MVILPGMFMHDGRGWDIRAPATKANRSMIAEFSDAIVGIILASVAAIVWLVRLEGKSNRYEELAKRLDDHIENDQMTHSKMLDDLMIIRESTAQIKGYLSMPDRKV